MHSMTIDITETSLIQGTCMQKSRFIVGLILIVVAALILFFGEGRYSTSGAVALGVLGLLSVAISRRNPDK